MSGPVHVAIVDDQPDLRLLARTMIEWDVPGALRITEAGDGQKAIDLCAADHVDVLVLDLHLPGMDGVEVVRRVSALQRPPCILAWSADGAALERAVAHGAEAGITKTDVDGLLAALHGCLGKSVA